MPCASITLIYFAAAITAKLSSHFEALGMVREAVNAQRISGFLIVAGILLLVVFIVVLFSVLNETLHSELVATHVTILNTITLIFTSLVAAYAWGWRQRFMAEGLDDLASVCHGTFVAAIMGFGLSLYGPVMLGRECLNFWLLISRGYNLR